MGKKVAKANRGIPSKAEAFTEWYPFIVEAAYLQIRARAGANEPAGLLDVPCPYRRIEEKSEQLVVRIAQGDLYLEHSAVEPFGFAAPLGGHKSGRPGAGRVAEAAEDERGQGSSRNLICGSLAAHGGAQA